MNAEVEYEISIEDLLEYLHEKHAIEGSSLDTALCFVLDPKMSVGGYIVFKVLYDTNINPSEWAMFEDIKKDWKKV